MNIDDNEQIEAHKVILTAVSPSPDQQKFEIEAYIQEMEQLKAEIMELKNVINKTNEEKQKQSNKVSEYRKELEIEKNKNIYVNLTTIENENLKTELKAIKENILEKDSEHKKEIEELKLKIKTMNIEKAQYKEPKPDDNKVIKEYKCNECDFKTNWLVNSKEHRISCKKNKREKNNNYTCANSKNIGII